MQVLAAVYANTGFNSVNIPDSIGQLKLMQFPVVYSGYLEINSTYLPKIRIKKTWSEICNADYVVLITQNNNETFCYTVSSIIMLANDVAELTLVIDAYNSIGGLLNPANQVLMGVVERYNVNDDSYGKYSLDESFTPQSPLELTVGSSFGQNDGDGYYNIIESMLDVDTSQAEVLNPSSAPNNEVLLIPKTKVINRGYVAVPTSSASIRIRMPVSRFYIVDGASDTSMDGTNISDYVKTLRSYGLDNAIINSYTVPKSYVNATNDNFLVGNRKNFTPTNTGIDLNYANVRNKKVIYGEFSKLKLYSICSGNSVEFRPEDVAEADGSYKIIIDSDPRASGKPVAYFEKFKKANLTGKYLNCVDGLNWANTPIVWVDKSGSNVDRANFETSQKLKSDMVEMNFNKTMVTHTGAAAVAATAAALTGVGTVAVAAGIAATAIKNLIDYQFARMEREREAKAEREIFERSQYYVQPEVSFVRSETLRDFVGNNFILTQCRLSQIDITNYDNFLTRFGYNVGAVTYNPTMINSRPHFNYIKFSTISIKSDRAMWLRKEVESQLQNGVRLWHTAPSPEKLLAWGNG